MDLKVALMSDERWEMSDERWVMRFKQKGGSKFPAAKKNPSEVMASLTNLLTDKFRKQLLVGRKNKNKNKQQILSYIKVCPEAWIMPWIIEQDQKGLLQIKLPEKNFNINHHKIGGRFLHLPAGVISLGTLIDAFSGS